MVITWKSNQELTDELRALKKELMDIKEHDMANMEKRLNQKIEIYMLRLSTIENRIMEKLT